MILRILHGSVDLLTNSWTIAEIPRCRGESSQIVLSYLWQDTLNCNISHKRIVYGISLARFIQMLKDSYASKLFVDLSDEYVVASSNLKD